MPAVCILNFFWFSDTFINTEPSCARSSMDRALVFGTSDVGSIPAGRIIDN